MTLILRYAFVAAVGLSLLAFAALRKELKHALNPSRKTG